MAVALPRREGALGGGEGADAVELLREEMLWSSLVWRVRTHRLFDFFGGKLRFVNLLKHGMVLIVLFSGFQNGL